MENGWKIRMRLFPEEVGVGAEAEANEFEAVCHDPVNQDEVGLDVAVAVAGELPFEGMVAASGGKGPLRTEQINDGHDFPEVLSLFRHAFEVAGKLGFENELRPRVFAGG